MPTCSSASPKNRTVLAFHVNQRVSASFSLLLSEPPGSGPLKDQQALSASFSLLLSYRQLQTTRFRSIKGPTLEHGGCCHFLILGSQLTCAKCSGNLPSLNWLQFGESWRSLLEKASSFLTEPSYFALFSDACVVVSIAFFIVLITIIDYWKHVGNDKMLSGEIFFFVSRIRCKKIQNQPNILLISSLFHPTTNNLVFLFCSPLGFPGSLAGKESTCHAGDPGSIPGLGRSPGEGVDYPLQYPWASLVA